MFSRTKARASETDSKFHAHREILGDKPPGNLYLYVHIPERCTDLYQVLRVHKGTLPNHH